MPHRCGFRTVIIDVGRCALHVNTMIKTKKARKALQSMRAGGVPGNMYQAIKAHWAETGLPKHANQDATRKLKAKLMAS